MRCSQGHSTGFNPLAPVPACQAQPRGSPWLAVLPQVRGTPSRSSSSGRDGSESLGQGHYFSATWLSRVQATELPKSQGDSPRYLADH